MELKMKYQYTYFIYPFAVKENKYQKYVLKLIKDQNFKLKLFEKEKDLKLYHYFLPKVSELLFSSLAFSKAKLKKLEELPEETKAAILSKYPCIIFESDLKTDIQGKTEKKGIFFKVQKLQLICFSTGICFLCLKTTIENSEEFTDLLNFNYKFREVNQENNTLKNFDKIYLQTDGFANMEQLTEFLEKIANTKLDSLALDVDNQKFLTFSYVCIDQQVWNEQKRFENIEDQYTKFSNFLPADNNVKFEEQKSIRFSEWKYAKLGIQKQGIALFTSSADINHYTILPDEYESQYFYTYILNLYKRIYLKKLKAEFSHQTNGKKTRKKFIEFTRNVWIQEVTEQQIGSSINQKIIQVLELDELYEEVKNRYDILYKELNFEKVNQSLRIVCVLLGITLLINILNFIIMIR